MGPAVPMPTERQRRLGGAVLIFSFATGLSRVIGLVREVVASYYFGAHGPINAFTVAYQFPNLVRALLADAALSSAFVPVFSELIEKGERKRAWRVASSLFWLMLLGLTALSAFFILIAPWVVRLFGVPGGNETLAVGLSRVLFPIVILLGISGIVVGILNTYDHFSVPALSPVFWNLAIVAGLVLGVPRTNSIDTQLYIYAFAILIATFIQVLLPMPWLRGLDRGEERLRVVIDWRDPAVKKTFKLMLPVTLGLGLININALIDVFFASRYINPDLAPTAIQKAFLIYMLPQGMFSVAIATVLFPRMARLAARGDNDGFRDTVSLGIRQITFLLFPAAVFSIVLATPVVADPLPAWRLDAQPDAGHRRVPGRVQHRARLQRRDADAQPGVLQPAVELDPDRGRAREPVPERRSSTTSSIRFGAWGIPLSTALVNVAGTIALVYLLRREMGGIDGRRTAASAARIVLAGAVAAGVSFAVWKPLDEALGHNLFITQLISLGLGLALGIGAYIGVMPPAPRARARPGARLPPQRAAAQ